MAGTTETGIEKATEIMNQINGLISAINPIAGAVIGIGKIIVALAKRDGVDIGTLETELVTLEATRARIQAGQDQWRAEHPTTPPTPPTP